MQPKTYFFESKNKWRKTIWNEVSFSIPPLKRQYSIVLYLGGLEDLDKFEAIEKGFREENLILVEKDYDIVKRLRKGKKIVIPGDFKNILNTWPAHTEIGVVLADFCEGLDFIFALKFVHILCLPAFWNTIFVFNFQRGREKNFNFWFRLLELKKELHRGKIFLDVNFDEGIGHARFFSYKSERGNLIFDSVIFENPRWHLDPHPLPPEILAIYNKQAHNLWDMEELNAKLIKHGLQILENRQREAALKTTRNVIRAALAVRSKRSNRGRVFK